MNKEYPIFYVFKSNMGWILLKSMELNKYILASLVMGLGMDSVACLLIKWNLVDSFPITSITE